MKSKCSNDRGRQAENAAHNYLTHQGLTLVVRNHRCRFGELDLVMMDSSTLVVAEVRSRKASNFATAAESVDRNKRNRIVMATMHLLRCKPRLNRYPIRFDVLTVNLQSKKIRWIRNAFTL